MGVIMSAWLGTWEALNRGLTPSVFQPHPRSSHPRPQTQALPQDSQAGMGSCRLPLTLSFFFVASQPSKKLCQKGK